MDLLEQLKQKQKSIKKDIKKSLNPNSAFNTLTDDEIALVLALRAKQIRKLSKKKQSDIGSEAMLGSATTYSNFEQTGRISMINFIKVMRALGRIDELEGLLRMSVKQSIMGYKINTP